MVQMQVKRTIAPAKKSGLRTLNYGEILFHENDNAKSLYIIQKGQIRLFRPKGRGFIEIAILRTGEVIGEMAYFDEKARRRSCSAEAMVQTDVIEVSFVAFGKTMEKLNPWFKTIINTLVSRLKKTNDIIKSLESNSVSFGRGGKVSEYKFFTNGDIVKGLSIFYLTLKTHGELRNNKMSIHINRLKFYAYDVFNYSEIKFEEIMKLFERQEMISMENDRDNLPKIICVADIEKFRNVMKFFNMQRIVDESKQLIISNKCEIFLKKIDEQLIKKGLTKSSETVDLSEILSDFKNRNIGISEEDLKDGIDAGLVGEIVVDTGNKLIADVNCLKLREYLPFIVIMNQIKKINESKAQTGLT